MVTTTQTGQLASKMMTTTTSKTFQGVLVRITFQKEAFLIGRFTCARKEFTALGRIIEPEIGTPYNLHGKWIQDPKWGLQFQFDSYTRAKIVGDSAVIRYLSKTAKWVGQKTAEAIVREFGDSALEMLQTNPVIVAQKIKGLSIDKALEIQTTLHKNAEIEGTLLALEKMIGSFSILHKGLTSKIAEKWGSEAIGRIKTNPYQLTEFHGIGFLTADQIALAIGFDPKSPKRQAAAIEYVLKKNRTEGHTWAAKHFILDHAKKLIKCDVNKGLEMILTERGIIQEGKFLALRSVYEDEKFIAEKLRRLSDEIPY